jgi:catechol 2,3-dioxygenase-like lactoylglutathione lyase family enzyme
MTAFQTITPLIPTGSTLEEAIRFYTEKLGFQVSRQWDGGAVIQRDSISFLLVVNNNREWADNTSFSIGVADLDALHQEYLQRGVVMGPLEVKFWGRREFHMIVPSGVCLQFYGTAA